MRQRRILFIGQAALAAVVMMVGTAYACTTHAGKISVGPVTSPTALPSGSGYSTATGNGTGQYCNGPNNGYTTRIRTTAVDPLMSVTVNPTPSADSCYNAAAYKLTQSGAAVQAVVTMAPGSGVDCMLNVGLDLNTETVIGVMAVAVSGSGTGNFPMVATAPGTYKVCVTAGSYGIDTEFTVTL